MLPGMDDQGEVGAFKQAAFGTPVGTASKFTPTADGGFVIHVRQRLPIDELKMKAQLTEFSNVVRQRRQSEAFEFWFNREASVALRDIPAFQQRNRPAAVQ
jgi:hypothetical protein